MGNNNQNNYEQIKQALGLSDVKQVRTTTKKQSKIDLVQSELNRFIDEKLIELCKEHNLICNITSGKSLHKNSKKVYLTKVYRDELGIIQKDRTFADDEDKLGGLKYTLVSIPRFYFENRSVIDLTSETEPSK